MKHHVPCLLPAVYFQFAGDGEVSSFTICYTLVAANIRERQKGALHVRIRPDAVPAPSPGKYFNEGADG